MSTPYIVDSLPALGHMLAQLKGHNQLSVDAEGLDLCRDGKLCLLVIATPDASVFLVDVTLLGKEALAFVGSGTSLQAILESDTVEKLMWDPRMDCDALFHQFGVKSKNVLDLQMAEVAYRRHVRHLKVRYVIGLGKALDEYVPPHVRLAAGSTVDKRMVGKMMDDDPQFWDRRPLSDTQVAYCAQDVVHLFALHKSLMLELNPQVMIKVRHVSAQRVLEYESETNPRHLPNRGLAPNF